MLKRLPAVLILIILLGWLFHPDLSAYSAAAQQSQPLPSVFASLWPEFDQPSMLVIYHITLPPGAGLPFAISLQIPASAGDPNAVAARQPDDSLVNIPYTLEHGSEWTRVVFNATSPELQIEYYDPLQMNGASRSYEYRWPGDYAVESFVIELQQPKDASDLKTSPRLGSGALGSDGLLYYTSQVGPLKQGQPFAILLNYEKDSEALSSSSMAVEPSGPIDSIPDTQAALRSALPWLLGSLAVTLVGSGAVWYLKSRRARPKAGAPRRVRHKTIAAQAGDSPPADCEPTHCHQCGRRAGSSDRFCRACGTPLRKG